MANITRKIGLSLGADVCWPICYEDLVERLDLAIPVGKDTVRSRSSGSPSSPSTCAGPRATTWSSTA